MRERCQKGCLPPLAEANPAPHASCFKTLIQTLAKGQALGGRHYKKNDEGLDFVDQNFDSYAVEYTYTDGTKLFFDGRCVHGARGVFQGFVHGTKGAAIAARSGDCGVPAAIFSDQSMSEDKQVWVSGDRSNPYQNEWDTLIDAIRNGKKHNEAENGVYASPSASLGRMAAHTGQEITMEQFLNQDHEFAPNVAQVTVHSASPLMPGPDGFYPRPRPGQMEREYSAKGTSEQKLASGGASHWRPIPLLGVAEQDSTEGSSGGILFFTYFTYAWQLGSSTPMNLLCALFRDAIGAWNLRG